MTSDDGWVNEALTDDSLAATMLLRLRAAALPDLRLQWTVRRSRSILAARHRANENGGGKRKADLCRASPTTPLSWSGATSLSGGAADGFEESSRLAVPLGPSRSEILAYTSEATTHKRPRKKTLAELKDEESLLLKERRSLKKELAMLRLKLESQRAKNESLKRMKLDMQSHNKTFKTTLVSSVASEETISDQLLHTKANNVTTTSDSEGDTQNLNLDQFMLSCSSNLQELGIQDASFLVPDLNAPLGDDFRFYDAA